MKKLFLMGRSEAGKTSLTQILSGEVRSSLPLSSSYRRENTASRNSSRVIRFPIAAPLTAW